MKVYMFFSEAEKFGPWKKGTLRNMIAKGELQRDGVNIYYPCGKKKPVLKTSELVRFIEGANGQVFETERPLSPLELQRARRQSRSAASK